MKNNELRNIILYVDQLKKQLEKLNINNEDINLTISCLLERINYLIEDEIKDSNYYLEMLKNNIKLLKIVDNK